MFEIQKVVNGSSPVLKEKAYKIKIAEPKYFNGAWCSKNLENFLWDIEQFFSVTRIPDAEKVTIKSIYLAGDAKWCCRTCVEDKEHKEIKLWDDLKIELKKQFLPCNMAYISLEALKKLKENRGPIYKYLQKFSSLMLDV